MSAPSEEQILEKARFGALVAADAAMRCSRRRPDRLLQDNDEQSGLYGRGAEGNNRPDRSQTMRVKAR